MAYSEGEAVFVKKVRATAEVWTALGCSNFEEGPTKVGGDLDDTIKTAILYRSFYLLFIKFLAN